MGRRVRRQAWGTGAMGAVVVATLTSWGTVFGQALRAAAATRPAYAVQAAGGGGGGGAGPSGESGGATGGEAGTGAPSQQPAAPEPAAGPKPAPEVTEPVPDWGPLAWAYDGKKGLEKATGTIPRLNVDLTSQSVVAGPDEFTSWVWRYDFGILQKLWPGAAMDLNVRGGEGPDAASLLGSTMNTNQYGGTGSDGFVLHLWFEQKLFDDQLTLRGGKMDLGDWMDVNRFGYYNFLGFSQNHNPAIEFPGNPLAAMFTIEPKAVPVYWSAGVANAAQSSFENGFPQLVDGPTAPFVMTEVGLKLRVGDRPGIYRFIGWYDELDLTPIGGGPVEDNRYGLALSFDQNVTKDFGLFARYGYADTSAFNPKNYWQAGFDWKGVIPTRPKDDLALAVAQNVFDAGRKGVVANASDYETYVEAYYNVVVYDWFQVQPVLQVLADPGGRDQAPAWIVSVHLAFRF